MKEIVSDEQYNMAGELKENMAIYAESEDLINVGAYLKGSNPKIDRAIQLYNPINTFLRQNIADHYTFDETVHLLEETLDSK